MTAYLVRRLVQMVPVLFLLSLFVFFLVRLVPGDPAYVMLGQRATPQAVARLHAQFKLDRPIWVQYGAFLGKLARGDLGESIRRREPVLSMVQQRTPRTIFLAAYAMVLSVLLSVPLATWAALNHGRWQDQVVRALITVSLAMPAFWVGTLLLQFFAVKKHLFPVAGYGSGPLGHLHALFLPALALALAITSVLVRSLRNAILETLAADYVRTARAKGLSGRRVFLWHVLRTSSLSSVTILGVNLAFLIGSTAIVESIFAVPGLGFTIIKAIGDRDYPVIQGVTLVFGLLVLTINLLTDLSYAMLDPRVSYT